MIFEIITLPEANIAPKNNWMVGRQSFPLGPAYIQVFGRNKQALQPEQPHHLCTKIWWEFSRKQANNWKHNMLVTLDQNPS